jgi:prolyl oligopeptidase
MREKSITRFVFVLLFALVTAAGQQVQEITTSTPPKTRIDDVKEMVQGVEITDSYRWLEDQNSPETRAWIDAQNAYTDSLLTKLPGRAELKQLLSALINVDTVGTPRLRNQRYFFLKRLAAQDQFLLYMRKGLTGKDEVLVDPLAMSADHSASVGIEDISHDGTLLAYSVQQGGADESTPHLYDVETRRDLPDRFPEGTYSTVSMLPDKSGLYVAKQSAKGPRVLFHKIGSDPASDVEIFGEGRGPEQIVGAEVSQDGHYLLIQVHHGTSSRTEIYVQDLRSKGPIAPIVNDLDAKFYGQIAGDRLFIRTNWKAPK